MTKKSVLKSEKIGNGRSAAGGERVVDVTVLMILRLRRRRAMAIPLLIVHHGIGTRDVGSDERKTGGKENISIRNERTVMVVMVIPHFLLQAKDDQKTGGKNIENILLEARRRKLTIPRKVTVATTQMIT